MTPVLSISIINTNNKEQTLACLRSVYAHSNKIDLEVFVVDNACTDGSAEAIKSEFPQVKLILNKKMLGFSTNNNMVLSRAAGKYLMLLNDDTVVLEGALEQMLSFMDSHPESGAVGACLLNPDGTYQQSWDHPPHPLDDGLRPLSSWFRWYQKKEPSEVGSVGGACMIVRRKVLEKAGLLDTDFDPLYSEEVDWCHRIRKAGWKIFHLPDAKVLHYGSQTMDRAPLNKIERLYQKKALFYKKHHGHLSVWVYKLSLWISSVFKIVLWLLIYPFFRKKAKLKIRSHFHIARKAFFL